MSVKLNCCEKCKDYAIKVNKEINPETKDMNMRVIYECQKCNHVFEGLKSSYHYHRLRSRGRII